MTTDGAVDISSLPRVAAIATMPSRGETFQKVLTAIRPQVDHVFVYLDGYDAAPAFLKGMDGVSVKRAEDLGDLHASSRFLCLQQLSSPTVVAMVDDDIVYPDNYVEHLVAVLGEAQGRAIVGVHGRIFIPPHLSYVKDAMELHFGRGLTRHCSVHEVGVGTCAFVSDVLDVDPRRWDRCDMNDITIAIEAQRRGLPRIAVAREAGWLTPHAQHQADSLWMKTVKDDSEHSRRMRALIGLYA
jgi:hypothetical protein